MLKATIFFALLLVSCGYAQVDDASRLILDYFDVQTANALADTSTILDRADRLLSKVTMYSFSDYGESVTNSKTIIDRPNERIAMESQTSMTLEDREVDTSFFLVYDDNAFSGVVSGFDGELEEVTFGEDEEAWLREQNDAMFALSDHFVQPEYSSARYDGRRVYADVLEGIQISVTGEDISATSPFGHNIGVGEMKMVFTDKLELAAIVMTTEGETTIIKLEEPTFEMSKSAFEMSFYSFDEFDNSVEFTGSSSVAYEAINEPLDDSLFVLPQISTSN